MGMVKQIPVSSLEFVEKQKPGPKPTNVDGEQASAPIMPVMKDSKKARSRKAVTKKDSKEGSDQ